MSNSNPEVELRDNEMYIYLMSKEGVNREELQLTNCGGTGF